MLERVGDVPFNQIESRGLIRRCSRPCEPHFAARACKAGDLRAVISCRRQGGETPLTIGLSRGGLVKHCCKIHSLRSRRDTNDSVCRPDDRRAPRFHEDLGTASCHHPVRQTERARLFCAGSKVVDEAETVVGKDGFEQVSFIGGKIERPLEN